MSRPHLTPEGKFQSDKYPACPAGKVPLSTKDPMAQPLLWAYAQSRREVDAEFSEDLETALKNDGYVPDVDVVLPRVMLHFITKDGHFCGFCGKSKEAMAAEGHIFTGATSLFESSEHRCDRRST